jgi:hypothetical protein
LPEKQFYIRHGEERSDEAISLILPLLGSRFKVQGSRLGFKVQGSKFKDFQTSYF